MNGFLSVVVIFLTAEKDLKQVLKGKRMADNARAEGKIKAAPEDVALIEKEYDQLILKAGHIYHLASFE